MRIALCTLLLLAPLFASAGPFDDAQAAARQGHYQDVVAILTDALKAGGMGDKDQVVAYSNRGIAYSLLGKYRLATEDLHRALSIDPTHNLTLNHLGILAEQVDKDPVAAASWYKKAADTGFAPSEVNLANLYRAGKGVPRDAAKALALYRDAVDQTYALAYTPLGEMYFDGEGTRPNPGLAVEMFRQAANAGIVSAGFYLGEAFREGRGVKADPARAVDWYRKAAMQGDPRAQNGLGYMYRLGQGTAQDFVEAAKWYRLAADQGEDEAMNRLAWLLATCPVKQVCNGEAAIEWARHAVAVHPYPSYLDSLAAGYARTGDFRMAIKVMQEVVTRLPADSALHAKYEQRLQQYKDKQMPTL